MSNDFAPTQQGRLLSFVKETTLNVKTLLAEVEQRTAAAIAAVDAALLTLENQVNLATGDVADIKAAIFALQSQLTLFTTQTNNTLAAVGQTLLTVENKISTIDTRTAALESALLVKPTLPVTFQAQVKDPLTGLFSSKLVSVSSRGIIMEVTSG